nr:hypothetical protein [Tanacetum cinerariifolium]
IAQDYEDSRARGFVHRSLELQSLACIYGFQKGQGSPGRNKTPGPWSARIPMWQLFKGLEDNNNVAIIIIKPNFSFEVIIYINPLNLSTVSFGVDAAMELKEKHYVFTAAGKDFSAARKK